jgi:hypothetical protein
LPVNIREEKRERERARTGNCAYISNQVEKCDSRLPLSLFSLFVSTFFSDVVQAFSLEPV